jgi:hypothetical protein
MSLMKSLHVVLELKTVVTAERYSMHHVLSRIKCALCIYLFCFTRLQTLSKVKRGCDFATHSLAAQDQQSFVLCFVPHTTNDLFTLLSKATRSYSTHAYIAPTRDRSSSRRYARHYSCPAGHRHCPWSPLARFKGRIGSLILPGLAVVICFSLTTHRHKTSL